MQAIAGTRCSLRQMLQAAFSEGIPTHTRYFRRLEFPKPRSACNRPRHGLLNRRWVWHFTCACSPIASLSARMQAHLHHSDRGNYGTCSCSDLSTGRQQRLLTPTCQLSCRNNRALLHPSMTAGRHFDTALATRLLSCKKNSLLQRCSC